MKTKKELLKFFCIIFMFMIIVSIAEAVDLSEFPGFFFDDSGNAKKNLAIIVGKAADGEDTLGAIDIAVMLQREAGDEVLDIARLDNEVEDLSAYNSIIVGGPCANAAAAKIMGYPENCLEGFEVGKAIIKTYEYSNGNIAMLVAGTTAMDTRRATYVVSNYKDHDLKGKEMKVAPVSMNDIIISNQ